MLPPEGVEPADTMTTSAVGPLGVAIEVALGVEEAEVGVLDDTDEAGGSLKTPRVGVVELELEGADGD